MSINTAAQRLQFARKALESAKSWEDQQAAQAEFDKAQEAMVIAAMQVNRGLTPP